MCYCCCSRSRHVPLPGWVASALLMMLFVVLTWPQHPLVRRAHLRSHQPTYIRGIPPAGHQARCKQELKALWRNGENHPEIWNGSVVIISKVEREISFRPSDLLTYQQHHMVDTYSMSHVRHRAVMDGSGPQRTVVESQRGNCCTITVSNVADGHVLWFHHLATVTRSSFSSPDTRAGPYGQLKTPSRERLPPINSVRLH